MSRLQHNPSLSVSVLSWFYCSTIISEGAGSISWEINQWICSSGVTSKNMNSLILALRSDNRDSGAHTTWYSWHQRNAILFVYSISECALYSWDFPPSWNYCSILLLPFFILNVILFRCSCNICLYLTMFPVVVLVWA